MRGEGVSRDHSRTRACSGKKTVRSCKVKGNLDNFVILDVDDDEIDDVIIIDVPQSLRQKLKSSTVLKDGKKFPCVICIDDDDDDDDGDDDGCHNVDCPEINVEGSGRKDDSNDASTRSSPTFGAMPKTVNEDADDLVILEKTSGFKLSKCQKTQSKGSPSRNRFGLSYESEDDLSESSSSDCEVMEGVGDLHEQWEKASLKKKSDEDKNKTGVEDQASPRNSATDVHPDVEVEYKQSFEASACSSSRNIDSDKRDSSFFTATRDECVGADSSNPGMENYFEKSGARVDEFSWWKHRSRENIGSFSKAYVNHGVESCGGDDFPHDECHSVNSLKAMRGTQWYSSFPCEQWCNKRCCSSRACSWEMEKDSTGEHSISCSRLRPNLHVDCLKAGVHGVKASSCNCVPAKVVLSEKDEQFTQARNGANTCSNEEHCKSPGSNEREKEKVVYGNKFVSDHVLSDDVVVENVVAPSANTASQGVPGVSYEKTSEQDFEKTDSGERFTCRSSCEERLDEPGTSRSAEEKEQFAGFHSNIRQENEKDHFTPFGEVLPVALGDVIFEREKLKDTDEYKRAAEEEWAERHRQLQIQAEEVQRLRKRKKAESLRILDMEKRLKQRVEEVRETKKKDEENLNIKERLRAEITKELHKLELTCANMASLLRGLGIRVEGGFSPPSHELHAAYKRALLKFHPDRASRTDIRQQVEAEEKFKLISRMKEKFLSTSSLIY